MIAVRARMFHAAMWNDKAEKGRFWPVARETQNRESEILEEEEKNAMCMTQTHISQDRFVHL